MPLQYLEAEILRFLWCCKVRWVCFPMLLLDNRKIDLTQGISGWWSFYSCVQQRRVIHAIGRTCEVLNMCHAPNVGPDDADCCEFAKQRGPAQKSRNIKIVVPSPSSTLGSLAGYMDEWLSIETESSRQDPDCGKGNTHIYIVRRRDCTGIIIATHSCSCALSHLPNLFRGVSRKWGMEMHMGCCNFLHLPYQSMRMRIGCTYPRMEKLDVST